MRYAACVPAAFALALTALCGSGPATSREPRIRAVVDNVIRPLMARDGIPGAAVGIVTGGSDYVLDYGVASRQPPRPVTPETLFEIGSITKTFTATLASWAQIEKRLSLNDDTAKYLPSLRGSAFGRVTLLELGTHTPGGLPLQVPPGITTQAQLLDYLRKWRPAYPPGTYRTYSNVGIGVLGVVTAQSMGQDFGVLAQHRLFPALGMQSTFIDVPTGRMHDYAEGYTANGVAVRLSPGVLWPPAYGIRSTAADLIRYVEANMNSIEIETTLRQAIAQTHTGYFRAGPMTQDLVWEQYAYPVSLRALLEGNSTQMLLAPNPVSKITPALQPRNDALIDKTGSTKGFGAYVAFVPERRLGIVILANKSFPIPDRVTAAYQILTALAKE